MERGALLEEPCGKKRVQLGNLRAIERLINELAFIRTVPGHRDEDDRTPYQLRLVRLFLKAHTPKPDVDRTKPAERPRGAGIPDM
jgi:hypothetical protein